MTVSASPGIESRADRAGHERVEQPTTARAPRLEPVRVLVVEDDQAMAGLLRRALTAEGYAVDVVSCGQDALWTATENDYDAIVLDVMIPAPDGHEVTRLLRERGRWSPVLMLTARDGVADRVRGLDGGADDHLSKPFAMTELYARLRALTRRASNERPVVLAVGGLTLDPVTRRVWRDGQQIDLTAKEFALLTELMRTPGRVLSRTHLLEHAWDFAYDGGSNVIDVNIRNLREKVDRPFGRSSIQTLRGAGYRIHDDG